MRRKAYFSSHGGKGIHIDYTRYKDWKWEPGFYNKKYIMPDDGILLLNMVSTHELGVVVFVNNQVMRSQASGADGFQIDFLIVSKGDVVSFEVSWSYSNSFDYSTEDRAKGINLRFYYLK